MKTDAIPFNWLTDLLLPYQPPSGCNCKAAVPAKTASPLQQLLGQPSKTDYDAPKRTLCWPLCLAVCCLVEWQSCDGSTNQDKRSTAAHHSNCTNGAAVELSKASTAELSAAAASTCAWPFTCPHGTQGAYRHPHGLRRQAAAPQALPGYWPAPPC